MSQDYLSDKDTLIVSKPLAKALGIPASVFLRRLRHWLDVNERNKSTLHFHDGRWWSYNTYQEWVDDLEIFSLSTVRRTINSLEDLGLVISTSAYNGRESDLTKWYSIDYQAYDDFIALWRHYGCPMYSDGKGSKEYNTLLDHWKSGHAPAHSGQGWMDLGLLTVNMPPAHSEQGGAAHSEQGDLLTEDKTPAHSEQRVTRESQRERPESQSDESTKTAAAKPLPDIELFYRDMFGEVPPIIEDELRDYARSHPNLIEPAFVEAAESNGRSWKYVRSIIDRWARDGIQPATTQKLLQNGSSDHNGGAATGPEKFKQSKYASFYANDIDDELAPAPEAGSAQKQTPPVSAGVQPPAGG